MKKHVDEATVVYSAAAWWRNCDPSMQVIALNKKVCLSKINAMMREAARNASESDYEEGIDSDYIAWSGIHRFALGTVVRDRELKDAIDALRDDGYYYPETY